MVPRDVLRHPGRGPALGVVSQTVVGVAQGRGRQRARGAVLEDPLVNLQARLRSFCKLR